LLCICSITGFAKTQAVLPWDSVSKLAYALLLGLKCYMNVANSVHAAA
jgi:hypothetical protein